jgi:hypothetical protein
MARFHLVRVERALCALKAWRADCHTGLRCTTTGTKGLQVGATCGPLRGVPTGLCLPTEAGGSRAGAREEQT